MKNLKETRTRTQQTIQQCYTDSPNDGGRGQFPQALSAAVAFSTIIEVRCTWCSCYMGEKDGEGVSGISHSICRDCWPKYYPGPYPDPEEE